MRLPGRKSASTLLAVVLLGCSGGLQAQAPASVQSQDTPVQSAPNALVTQALREIHAQQLRQAEQHLRSAIAQEPNSAQAHSLLGYVLFRERQATQSLAEYTLAAQKRTPSSDELLVVASDYILLRDYADAAHWLHYVTEHDSTKERAWYLLGRTEFNQDHAAEAVSAFDRCLAINARDMRAIYNRGLALEKLGRAAEAAQAYETAIAMESKSGERDAQPYLDLGSLLLSQSKSPQAVQMLEHASSLAPENAFILQQLGKAYEAAGKNADAVKAYQAAITLSPGSEQPHFLLGRLLRREGDEKGAAAQFEIVRSLVGNQSAKETPNEEAAP